ncbi:MAG: hypothetical protein PHV19_01500 [Bacilli bacterium]|nr:hypothetical protein [Bacilli bacterium]
MENLIENISFFLGVSSFEIDKYANPNPYYFYYKKIAIPKRNGNKRLVYVPIP